MNEPEVSVLVIVQGFSEDKPYGYYDAFSYAFEREILPRGTGKTPEAAQDAFYELIKTRCPDIRFWRADGTYRDYPAVRAAAV